MANLVLLHLHLLLLLLLLVALRLFIALINVLLGIESSFLLAPLCHFLALLMITFLLKAELLYYLQLVGLRQWHDTQLTVVTTHTHTHTHTIDCSGSDKTDNH